jgi:hypothetical protein
VSATAQASPSHTSRKRQQLARAQGEALQQLFPIGSRVRLKFCPDSGEPGEVVGYERGKVIVRWHNMGRDGRYMSCSLWT